MPLCGFNAKMLEGMAKFADGVFEQVVKRSERDGISLKRAFEIEMEEMGIFLIKLDEKYHKELRPQHNVEEAMNKLIEWTAFEHEKGEA